MITAVIIMSLSESHVLDLSFPLVNLFTRVMVRTVSWLVSQSFSQLVEFCKLSLFLVKKRFINL